MISLSEPIRRNYEAFHISMTLEKNVQFQDIFLTS